MFDVSLKEELQTISGLSNRVFPVNAPENFPAPYIVYLTAEQHYKTLDGFIPSGRINAEINLICKTPSELKTLSRGVIIRLQSFLMRSIGVSEPVYIQDVEFVTEPSEIYEQEIKAYRSVFEITIQV